MDERIISIVTVITAVGLGGLSLHQGRKAWKSIREDRKARKEKRKQQDVERLRVKPFYEAYGRAESVSCQQGWFRRDPDSVLHPRVLADGLLKSEQQFTVGRLYRTQGPNGQRAVFFRTADKGMVCVYEPYLKTPVTCDTALGVATSEELTELHRSLTDVTEEAGEEALDKNQNMVLAEILNMNSDLYLSDAELEARTNPDGNRGRGTVKVSVHSTASQSQESVRRGAEAMRGRQSQQDDDSASPQPA